MVEDDCKLERGHVVYVGKEWRTTLLIVQYVQNGAVVACRW